MAYVVDIYTFNNSKEYEYKFAGEYGGKNEKKRKWRKPTKEEEERRHQKEKETRIRRLIKANFQEKDLWCCLKYPEGTKVKPPDAKKDIQRFLRSLRTRYKRAGSELKFIYRMEVSSKGGVHFHIIVNRIWTEQTDVILQECWSRALALSVYKERGHPVSALGLVDFRPLYESGSYEQLAEYITKKPKEDSEEYRQLSFFDDEDQKTLATVSTSRNLIRPKPVRKKYQRWTVRKIVEDGVKPSPGYFIDKDSVMIGVNPFNGWTYIKYTEIRIKTRYGPEAKNACKYLPDDDG